MCQKLTYVYSCGCVKEQVLDRCKYPKPSCVQQKYYLARVPLDEPCPEHRDHPAFRTTPYTYTQDWTVLPAAALDPDHSATTPGHSTKRVRYHRRDSKLGERVEPTLSTSQEHRGANMSSTLGRSQNSPKHPDPVSGKSPGAELLQNPPQSVKTLRRKPVAADIMSIPVYDNGTDAALKAAEALKKVRSNKVDSRDDVVSRTTGQRSSRPSTKTPPTSFPSTPQRRSSLNRTHNYPSSRADEDHDPSLYPAPLNITKSRASPDVSSSSSHRIVQIRSTGKYDARSLPPTPGPTPSNLTWNQTAPHAPDGTSRRPARTPDATRVPNHGDARRAYEERQASEMRILDAKRAIDSGRYARQSSCREIESLTRGERQTINNYIQEKRDAERRARESERRDREAEAKKVKEINRSQLGKKRKNCSIM